MTRNLGPRATIFMLLIFVLGHAQIKLSSPIFLVPSRLFLVPPRLPTAVFQFSDIFLARREKLGPWIEDEWPE